MRKTIISLYIIVTVTMIYSCATRGAGPQGGPKDTTPPQVVKYSPADGCVNMQRNRIEITFDEIVSVQNASQNVVVSPPQLVPADIKAISHKVVVEFMDSLRDSTTYSIDFGSAIVDYNEGNKLEGFTYCFSTGDHLDSLQISGKVISAENLNPVAGIYVGVHRNLDDSAFTRLPFERITKSNDRGEFCIKNLPTGSYKVYALNDIGSNYMKDMPGEEVAFLDSVYTPKMDVRWSFDTVYNQMDSSKIDTIITHRQATYTPVDLLLHSFVEEDMRRYLVRSARPERYKMQLMFNGKANKVPELRLLDSLEFNPVVTANANYDTITYWLSDTVLTKTDTLECLLSYERVDIDSSYTTNDTITFVYRQPKSAAKNRGKKQETSDKPVQPQNLTVSSNAADKFDVYKPLEVRFVMPTEMSEHDTVDYKLEEMEDTLWKEVRRVKLRKGDEAGTLYIIEHEWKAGTSYRLTLDSALFTNMIGLANKQEQIRIKTKSLEEYSKLILHLGGVHGDEVVQLLNEKDEMVREIALTDSVGTQNITFEYVNPGIYYMRLYRDTNRDGHWTSGLYEEHRQAEEVVYFPYDIELRAFWDVEEDWNPYATSMPKPKELIKNNKKK